MSYLTNKLKPVAAAILAIFIIFSSLFGCSSNPGTCSEQSEVVRYARSLSQDRLGRLYQDIKSFAESDKVLHRVKSNSETTPPELGDLHYHDILLDGNTIARILLEGCFDHYVILRFNGIYNDSPSAIILSWGEGPGYGKEQLWPK